MKRQGESKGNSLRKRAEEVLSQKPETVRKMPVEDIKRLIHELDVHQIELEMQNEELRRQQAESDEARDRYRDLYDFAPIGYFTFAPDGRIEEVNLAGARLLGLPRSRLIGRSFSVFVERDFSALFRMHLQEVFASDVRQTCELKIGHKPGKSSMYVSLESVAAGKNEEIKCRSAMIDISERKRMEEALREYESVIENSRDIITVVDRNYKYVLANAQFLKYQGLDRSQVIGKSATDLLGKDVFETVVKKNLDACFRGETVQYEMKRVYPELGERDLLVRYLPVENPGSINRIVSIIQDITQRKRAEGVAQARLRMLEADNTVSVDQILQRALDEIELQTGSRLGFYHFLEADQETLSLQSWSTNTVRNMCTAEGKGSHYPVSKAGVWVDCVHERRPVIHNDFASLPHRKGMPPGHAPVIREMVVPIFRSGQIVAIIGVGNKPTDYDATDVEIASLLGDLSWEIIERRRAEQVLRQSEKRYRSYIEVTMQLGWTANANGEVVEDIPSWRKFTGQREAEVKGWGWSKALHTDDLENTIGVWRNAVTTRKNYEAEYRIRRYDGVYRHFLARGVPVFKNDGNIQEWVGACIDITERKQIENAEMFLVRCGLPASGEDFFKSLARYLAENLGMDYVCIDRLQEKGLAAQTVAIYFDGEFEDNLTYTLKDTPCGDVAKKTICCFPKGVRRLYPQDAVLQEMMAESYVGTILWSSKGQPIGLIAIIGRQPLANPQLAESMLKLAAVRAAGELERREAEDALRRRSLELQQLTETLEQRVLERTAELATTNEALRHLSMKLLSAQEDERKRIGGELHDTIGSYLTGIKFKVESVLQQLRETRNVATESLSSIIPVIQEGVEECRRIQMDLRPPMLDDLGLLATLSWFFRTFQALYPAIRIEPEIGIEEGDVPLPLKIVVFRVTQEALNNVAKYSKADLARLSLRKIGDRMELVIRDNGQGFNLEDVRSPVRARRGLGLTSMRERIEFSGGSFSVESTEGKGTTVRASFPFRGEQMR